MVQKEKKSTGDQERVVEMCAHFDQALKIVKKIEDPGVLESLIDDWRFREEHPDVVEVAGIELLLRFPITDENRFTQAYQVRGSLLWLLRYRPRCYSVADAVAELLAMPGKGWRGPNLPWIFFWAEEERETIFAHILKLNREEAVSVLQTLLSMAYSSLPKEWRRRFGWEILERTCNRDILYHVYEKMVGDQLLTAIQLAEVISLHTRRKIDSGDMMSP